MPKISVCIPSYNHQNYISDTLNSVLNQSFQDFEIIISDDNSSDNTVQVIKGLNDPRIKLIENRTNNGPSINANLAINHASSDLIALIASDDTMKIDRLEKALNHLNSDTSLDAVFTYVQTIDENGEKIEHKMMDIFNRSFDCSYQILNHFFFQGNFLCAPSCLIKKTKLLEVGGFNPCLWQLQDLDLWIKMIIGGSKIGFVPEKLTNYRVGNNNLSSIDKVSHKFLSRINFETEKILENFLLIKKLEDFIKIFPVIVNKYQVVEDNYIEFYLMQEALEVLKKKPYGADYASYKSFATNIAYRIIYNEKMRKKVLKDFNFGILDFLDMMSNNPLINADNFKSRRSSSFVKKLSNSCQKRISTIKNLFDKS